MTEYRFYTTNEIKPLGWTKRQLRLQAEGLSGNLDKVWPDVRDSSWIGGDCEGWERVPYWLDGFIPLAYLLDDDDMKARAKYYIDHIIANQQEDGWICPNGEKPRDKYDTWAVLLITKVLVNYAECSNDERIADVVYRVMKNYYELLKDGSIALFQWGEYRWFEGFIALNWLYDRYAEEWIRSLALLLREQGHDYRDVRSMWVRPLNKWTLDTHVVNLAMMFKSEAVSCELLGEDYVGIGDELYDELMKYNGTSVETMTGDECLSGISPIQGTELCSVVEEMYALEQLYAYTGDRKWAERLERVAFNALPAAITDDMWAHQYDQLSNQIDCTPLPKKGKPIFRTNNFEAHVFGLEPHFGCCTANFGQGWPKLVLSSFMQAKDGVLSAVPIPAELKTSYKGTGVCVRLDTEYPFRNTLRYTVTCEKKTSMRLRVRVPSFAKSLKVNGEPVAKRPMLVFGGFPAGETVITVSFEATPELVAAPTGSLSKVRYGSLVFSVPVDADISIDEYERCSVERKFPYCDYHYKSASDWNYAYTSRELKVVERPVSEIPFSSKEPAVVIEANVAHIDWGYADGYDTICAKTPEKRKPIDAPQKIELYPYGCAKLRMTELPLLSFSRKRK